MAREHFTRQLADLRQRALLLAEQTQSAIGQAIDAFQRQDAVLARKVVDEDGGINRIEREVLDRSTTLLMLEAPVASDLRLIIGISRIANHFERAADHARDMANSTLRAVDTPQLGEMLHLTRLIDDVSAMVSEGVVAIQTMDPVLAREICKRDDAVDRVYSLLFAELLAIMQSDVSLTARVTYTLLIARDLERIADYTTDVAEAVVYIATGHTEELN